jgi:hypothetical protein
VPRCSLSFPPPIEPSRCSTSRSRKKRLSCSQLVRSVYLLLSSQFSKPSFVFPLHFRSQSLFCSPGFLSQHPVPLSNDCQSVCLERFPFSRRIHLLAATKENRPNGHTPFPVSVCKNLDDQLSRPRTRCCSKKPPPGPTNPNPNKESAAHQRTGEKKASSTTKSSSLIFPPGF